MRWHDGVRVGRGLGGGSGNVLIKQKFFGAFFSKKNFLLACLTAGWRGVGNWVMESARAMGRGRGGGRGSRRGDMKKRLGVRKSSGDRAIRLAGLL